MKNHVFTLLFACSAFSGLTSCKSAPTPQEQKLITTAEDAAIGGALGYAVGGKVGATVGALGAVAKDMAPAKTAAKAPPATPVVP